jgi:hypothetical protein
VTTKLRLELIPQATRFKVVNSYQLEKKSFLDSYFSTPEHYLNLEDENNLKSEIPEGFINDFVGSHADASRIIETTAKYSEMKNQITKMGQIPLYFCVMNHSATDSRYAKQLLGQFVSRLNFEKVLLINKLFWAKHKEYPTTSLSCAEVLLKSIDPYLFLNYYADEISLHELPMTLNNKSKKLDFKNENDRSNDSWKQYIFDEYKVWQNYF